MPQQRWLLAVRRYHISTIAASLQLLLWMGHQRVIFQHQQILLLEIWRTTRSSTKRVSKQTLMQKSRIDSWMGAPPPGCSRLISLEQTMMHKRRQKAVFQQILALRLWDLSQHQTRWISATGPIQVQRRIWTFSIRPITSRSHNVRQFRPAHGFGQRLAAKHEKTSSKRTASQKRFCIILRRWE